MTFRLAGRMRGIRRTLIRRIFEQAPPGAINLGLGQPDLPTPPAAALGGIAAIAEGRTAYTATAGDADVHFVDVTGVTLGSDGRPRPELFTESGERPSELGFLEWSLVTKPVVLEAQARYRMLRECDRWGCGALR